jgi:hypothetical protein
LLFGIPARTFAEPRHVLPRAAFNTSRRNVKLIDQELMFNVARKLSLVETVIVACVMRFL